MRDEDKTKEQLIAELKTLRGDDKRQTQTITALRDIEVRYDTLFHKVPIAIFTKDVDGYYTSVNSNALANWEHHPIGKRDIDLLPEDIARPIRTSDLRILETGEEYYGEIPFMTGHGIRIFLTRKVPLRNAEGEIIGILGTAIDITERKELDRQALLLEFEKQRVELLTKFITLSSHEFRTPLSSISLSAQLLQRYIDDAQEKSHRHLNKILRHVDDLNLLLNNMMKLATLSSTPTIDMQDDIEFNKLVRDIWLVKQEKFQTHHLQYQLDTDDQQLYIKGNRFNLIEAIRQIINNAIRHTGIEGEIKLRVCRAHDKAVLEVIDTGKGIKADELEHIFEAFYRADEAGSTRGFGLGLPIAKAIIEQHNGSIKVKSTPEKGSTFKVIIPLAEAQP